MTKEKKRGPYKVLGIISIILLIISSLFITSVQIVFKNENVTPSLFGYSLYLMEDDYMDGIPKNSMIFATNGTPTKEDISKAVVVDDVAGYGTTVMRLVNITVENDQVFYELKFDKSTDTVMAREKKIVGIADYSDVFSGRLIVLAKTGFGITLFLGIPALLAIIFFALNSRRKTRLRKLVEKRRIKYHEELKNSKELQYVDDLNNPVTLDEFVSEGQPNVTLDENEKESKLLNEPLIEEGVKKDELVEIKEDLTQPTNNAIEELMKILEEENAKLKELELDDIDEKETKEG